MPLYELQCLKCGIEFEQLSKIKDREEVLCRIEGCNGRTKILMSPPKRDWFRPHYNPNLGLDPVYVKSKQHLKELCLEKNVTSEALGDVRNITEI